MHAHLLAISLPLKLAGFLYVVVALAIFIKIVDYARTGREVWRAAWASATWLRFVPGAIRYAFGRQKS